MSDKAYLADLSFIDQRGLWKDHGSVVDKTTNQVRRHYLVSLHDLQESLPVNITRELLIGEFAAETEIGYE